MRRFASGLPISGQRVPLYDEEDESPDIRSLDLSEIEDEIARLHKSVERAKAEQKIAADEKQAAKDKEIEAALAAYRNQAAKGQPEKNAASEAAQNAPQAQSTILP